MRVLILAMPVYMVGGGLVLAARGDFLEAAMVGGTGLAAVGVVLCFSHFWAGLALLLVAIVGGLQFKDYPAAPARYESASFTAN